MSAPPRRSSRLSNVAAAAASSPSPQTGDKRRTADSAAAASTLADQQRAASAISDGIDAAAAAPSLSLPSAAPAASAAAATTAPAAAAAASSVGARRKQKKATGAASAIGSAATIPAALPSRWCGLYSDALHSILQFASLSELSRILAVSRRWSDAVMTMPPVQATNRMGDTFHEHRLQAILDVRPLQPTDFSALRSRVARHVSSFDLTAMMSVDCLEIVSQLMPWICDLWRPVPPSEPQTMVGALGRFHSLTRLQVHFHPLQQVSWNASDFNSIIEVIGGLSMLECVWLFLPSTVFPRLSFAPLIALQRLHTLTLSESNSRRLPSCTDSQIAEFRSMHSLKSLHVASGGDSFVRMLQPGHAFQWTELRCGTGVTEPLAPLLGSLPSLTRLDVFMVCSDVSFLSQLRELTHVGIRLGSAEADPDELVHALSHCSQLRRLNLAGFTLDGDHLAQLLPCFPKLADLSLRLFPAVESLRCFDTPALAASLTRLSLQTLLRCSSSEVVHLSNLRNLHSLTIKQFCSSVRAQFAVLSQRFPFLRQCDPPEQDPVWDLVFPQDAERTDGVEGEANTTQ